MAEQEVQVNTKYKVAMVVFYIVILSTPIPYTIITVLPSYITKLYKHISVLISNMGLYLTL